MLAIPFMTALPIDDVAIYANGIAHEWSDPAANTCVTLRSRSRFTLARAALSEPSEVCELSSLLSSEGLRNTLRLVYHPQYVLAGQLCAVSNTPPTL
jgi:hypothetical protein